MLPQTVQDLLFLHGGGGDLLLQAGNAPLQIQKVFIHVLAGAALGRTLGLQVQLFPVQRPQALFQCPGLTVQRFQLLPELCLLGLGIGDRLAVRRHRRLLLRPVARQVLRQTS